ncbi:MAG TPA: hypothetical protein VH228_00430 [Nocardioides sp.]|jgi:hypothetical protein|nr:hypothetical protein [Nocardioides sp.]
MGIVHRATLTPSKQELVEAWLPSRAWAEGRTITEKVAEYRFDDPAGQVGVETILWRTDDGTLLQTPLTYRGAPLAGGDSVLIGTCGHSVLGPRWVYDGCGDPIWAATLTTAILTGGQQAQMMVEHDGELVDVPARMQVRGSGSAETAVPAVSSVESLEDDGAVTRVSAGPVVLSLARVVGTPLTGDATLTGVVGDQDLGTLATVG